VSKPPIMTTNETEMTEESTDSTTDAVAEVETDSPGAGNPDADPASLSAEDEPAKADEGPSLEEVMAERDQFKDRWLRAHAELDNTRKRKQKELSELRQKTREQVMLEILPIIDNLERAVDAASTAADVAAVVQGVKMVLRSFQDTAERIGLKRVPSVGERFDPGMHEAWQHTETNEKEPGSVIAEFEPGYFFGTRLLRPAKVAVARPLTQKAEEEVAETTSETPPSELESDLDSTSSDDEEVLFVEDTDDQGENTPAEQPAES